jgi:pimeloyl-ACP methyl ester carboxylesterase
MTDLNVLVSGDGPPVTLVHAGVADLHSYDAVAAELSATHTVIRYDMRGFGASPAPTAAFSHLDDLTAVLDELGVTRTALVGNSFGGYVALTFAVTHPERVTHLALLASALGGWKWGPAMRAYDDAETAALEAGDLDEAVRVNQEMWVRGPARDWSPELRALADALAPAMRTALANQEAAGELEAEDDGPSVDDRLGRITARTVVASGLADDPDFDAIAHHLADRIAGARYAAFPGVGHLMPVERPTEIATLIADLLKA